MIIGKQLADDLRRLAFVFDGAAESVGIFGSATRVADPRDIDLCVRTPIPESFVERVGTAGLAIAVGRVDFEAYRRASNDDAELKYHFVVLSTKRAERALRARNNVLDALDKTNWENVPLLRETDFSR